MFLTTKHAVPRLKESDRSSVINISYEAAKAQIFTDETALGTLVEGDDTASVAAFLASENGRHITTQDINVDAGMVWY